MIVSIIIPVYNSQETILKCINSIQRQTYREIEIIVVNDGSTDNSLEILSTINDERISIYTKRNSGALNSRLFGVGMAKGDYIMFVDSDDWIEPNMVETMVNNTDDGKYDFIMCGLTYDDKNHSKRQSLKEKNITNKNQIKRELVDFFITESINGPCCKLIRRKLVSNITLKLNFELTLQEDLLLNIEILKKINNFKSINKCLYHYVKNDSSATHTYVMNKFDMTSFVYKEIEKFFLNEINKNDFNRIQWICIKNFYAAIIDFNMVECDLSLANKVKTIEEYKNNYLITNTLNSIKKSGLSWQKKFLIMLLKFNGFTILIFSKIMYNLKYNLRLNLRKE